MRLIQCKICKHIKPISDFYKNKTGYSHKCKCCHIATQKKIYKNIMRNICRHKRLLGIKKKYRDKNKEKIYEQDRKYRSTWEGKFSQVKRQAIHRGIKFKLKLKDIKNMPMICYYTGMKLTLEQKKLNTLSIDRLNNSKGYVINNIVFCSKIINEMKSDRTEKQFVELCKLVAAKYK